MIPNFDHAAWMDAKEAALAVSQMRNVERGLEAAQRIVRIPPPTAAELVSGQSRLEPADDPYAQFSPDAAAAGHLAESVASQRYALSPTGSIHARMEGLEQARRVQNSLTPTAAWTTPSVDKLAIRRSVGWRDVIALLENGGKIVWEAGRLAVRVGVKVVPIVNAISTINDVYAFVNWMNSHAGHVPGAVRTKYERNQILFEHPGNRWSVYPPQS